MSEVFEIAGEQIQAATRQDIEIEVAQSVTGAPIVMPATVIRGKGAGPAVTVCAAVHGDEINGTGIVRSLILDPDLTIDAGTLILVPVVNIPGFERHSRYLPDRRDLNRCFPGSAQGSFSSRYAHAVFSQIVKPSDYLIDLHTAAVRRTNFPNVRANLRDPNVKQLSQWLGCEIVVNNRGPKGSLRRCADDTGHPTVVLELGEVWKVEPAIVDYGTAAIRNVLCRLEMSACPLTKPRYQARVYRTQWIRAEQGGMLQFHVAPGELVEKDQPLATNSNLLGIQQNVLHSPSEGVILGMTTLPFVTPGDPICHIGVIRNGIAKLRKRLDSKEELQQRLLDDLATSVDVEEYTDS